jgi:hypothetical protein
VLELFQCLMLCAVADILADSLQKKKATANIVNISIAITIPNHLPSCIGSGVVIMMT